MFLITMPSGGEWIFLPLGMMAIVIVPYVFYLITLQNALKQVSIENRKMEPGLVWLMFIPLFNIVWQFIIVTKIADSLTGEFRTRGLQLTERPGYGVGLAYCICLCFMWLPLLGTLIFIAAVVLWIMHWVKINEYKNRLMNTASAGNDADSVIFKEY